MPHLLFSPRMKDGLQGQMFIGAAGDAVVANLLGHFMTVVSQEYLHANPLLAAIFASAVVIFAFWYVFKDISGFNRMHALWIGLGSMLTFVGGVLIQSPDTASRTAALAVMAAGMWIFIRFYSEGPEPKN